MENNSDSSERVSGEDAFYTEDRNPTGTSCTTGTKPTATRVLDGGHTGTLLVPISQKTGTKAGNARHTYPLNPGFRHADDDLLSDPPVCPDDPGPWCEGTV